MAENNAEFAQVWADAFSLYQEKTKRQVFPLTLKSLSRFADPTELCRDLKGDPVLTALWTTDDLLKEIEVREQQFRGFREKKAKLWEVLRRSMTGVEVLSGLTQNALTLTPFSMASPVLGAVLFLVGSAKGVSEAYDSITTLLSKLEDFTGRLQEYTRAAVDPKLKKKVVDILTTLLEIFARSEKLIKKGRLKQYMSGTFLGSNGKVASAMARLNSLMDTENRLVGSLVYSTVLKTNETVDRSEKTTERNEKALQSVSGSLNELKKDANEKIEKERLDKLDREVLGKVQDRHNYVLEQMLEGSGNWIKEEPLYKGWINEEEPILWIFGGPGAGKSFLSSKIVSHLLDHHSQAHDHSARISVGYFYIKENDERLRSVNAIFKSVALQIADDNPVYKKHVVNVCESPDRIGTAKNTWRHLFLDFFGSQQSVDSAAFVVIDGLDEAPKAEREMFLELLKSLEDYPSKRPRLNFVIVGRPELRDTISAIWESHKVFIEVSAAKNRADIEEYINGGMRKVRTLKNKRIPLGNREKLRVDIVNKLKEGANGMFLWVNLMLDQISDVSRPSDIRNALEQAPQDLAKMIRHVFERLAGDPSVQKDDFNEMLIWITFARTPLLLGQMDVILKLRGEIGEGMPDLEDRLRGQFSSFFTLEREDNMTTESLQLPIQDIPNENISHEAHEEHSSDQAGESHDMHQTVEELEEEDYAFHPYGSDFKTTLLVFSHASIRDYLVQEGRPATRKYPVDLGIGIDVNKAEHHITATCLSIICDTEHESLYFDNNMLEYAADNFLKHLQKVDRSSLSRQEKESVVRPLFTIFQSDPIMKRWIEKCSDRWSTFVQSWSDDSMLIRCVRDWFADEDNIDLDFTAEERAHLQYASISESNLFERLARYCASQWLSDQDSDDDYPEFFVWFLHIYLCWNDESSYRDGTNDISLNKLDLSEFLLKRLRLLAEYGDFEQNAFWHRRLAKIYREAAYNNAAIREFSISIKLNDQDDATLEGMAYCYEERKDYLSAIEWVYKAVAALPKESKVEKARLLQQISTWKSLLEDKDGAIEASHAAYSLTPHDTETSFVYLTALENNSEFQAILDFAAKLEKLDSVREGENMLTFLFVETWGRVHDIIGNAAKRLGRIDSVEQPMRDALAAAERRESSSGLASSEFTIQRCFFGWADFLNRYAYKMDEAIEVYETALERLPKRKRGDVSWSPRIWINDSLCQLYYPKAKAAEGAGIHFDHWVVKLEGLAKTGNAKGGQDVSASEDASLMLGLWYRLHGREQEAKLCFRRQILNGIDTLTDDDPGNDMFGYMTLALTLLKAGDRENAGAAFAVTTAPLDRLKDSRRAAQKAGDEDKASKEKTIRVPLHSTDAATLIEPLTSSMEKSETKDPEEKTRAIVNDADGDAVAADDKVDIDSAEMTTQIKRSDDIFTEFVWGCHGNCRRRLEDWQEVHFCEICTQYTSFCDECVKLVKAGTLPFRKCDASHTFYQGYPLSKEMQDIATVRTEGKIMPRTEWLEALRKKWTA